MTLAQAGYAVLAGVRNDKDAAQVELQHANIHAVIIDVSQDDSVSKAVLKVNELIGDNKGQLVALVNNAGVSCHFPVELTPIQELQQCLNVNLIGVYRATQAFLPLLRQSSGARILVTGSLAGLVALPNMSAYSASKHALEAVCDAMRVEMMKFDIKVSLLEPGFIDSKIAAKSTQKNSEVHSKINAKSMKLYQGTLDKMAKSSGDVHKFSIPADATSRAIMHGVTSAYPKPRYLCGTDARVVSTVKAVTHWRLLDMILYKGFVKSDF